MDQESKNEWSIIEELSPLPLEPQLLERGSPPDHLTSNVLTVKHKLIRDGSIRPRPPWGAGATELQSPLAHSIVFTSLTTMAGNAQLLRYIF